MCTHSMHSMSGCAQIVHTAHNKGTVFYAITSVVHEYNGFNSCVQAYPSSVSCGLIQSCYIQDGSVVK